MVLFVGCSRKLFVGLVNTSSKTLVYKHGWQTETILNMNDQTRAQWVSGRDEHWTGLGSGLYNDFWGIWIGSGL